jgi:hypothetical protein
MYRLKDRNRQIPGSLKFYQPQTKWAPPPWASFSVIVQAVISHRRANPWLGLTIEPTAVENEVDLFNANLCAQMGWADFIIAGEGDPNPNPQLRPPSLGNRLQNVAEGAEANVEFIKSKEEAVPSALSTARAAICAECPQNGKGGLERFFTVPVALAIREVYAIRRGWNLSTPHDDKIGVCEACNCPLKLKCHFPLKIVREHISKDAMGRLDPRCWILTEQ